MTTVNLAVGPLVALIAGVLILIVPRLLNYIVAIYLMLIGLIGIFGWGGNHVRTSAMMSNSMPALTAVFSTTAPRPSREFDSRTANAGG